ncbi:MAG: nucleotidyltransferase family protein [Parasphingopyxis sp.]|uniref:nucleotidyltransferase family protein n=1 Tax=Parasphingopyxis sp. TaxID=1920299 RepID=UPI003FA03FF5
MRAAIILAAGRSQRFGAANKLLARYRGKPLLQWAIEHALRAPVGRALLVVGADHRRLTSIAAHFPAHRITTVVARTPNESRRKSLLYGLRALRRHERECFVFLGDLPDLPGGVATRLAVRARRGAAAVRARHRGTPGHPVLIGDTATTRKRLEAGDKPFEQDEMVSIECGRAIIADIDRPCDLRAVPVRA